jgi:hypothetical protein
MGHVKVLFHLPEKFADGSWVPHNWLKTCVAYIEWFTPFKLQHGDNHHMYSVSVPPLPAN